MSDDLVYSLVSLCWSGLQNLVGVLQPKGESYASIVENLKAAQMALSAVLKELNTPEVEDK